jgi:hypothetical protein
VFCPTFEVPNENSSPFGNKQSLGNSYVRSTIKGHYKHSTNEKIHQHGAASAHAPLCHISRARGVGASRTTPACQSCLLAAASCGEFTPPSRIVRVQPGNRSSAKSSLSASHEAHAVSAASSTPINQMDVFASSDLMMMMLLLPRKHSQISQRGNQTTTPLRPETIQLAGKRRKIEC